MSDNIAKKFVNLYQKAEQKRLLTDNMAKKFMKELDYLYKNVNKTRAALTLRKLSK
jgi:O-methyltransferase involved in polyketide biosynthesis